MLDSSTGGTSLGEGRKGMENVIENKLRVVLGC